MTLVTLVELELVKRIYSVPVWVSELVLEAIVMSAVRDLIGGWIAGWIVPDRG